MSGGEKVLGAKVHEFEIMNRLFIGDCEASKLCAVSVA